MLNMERSLSALQKQRFCEKARTTRACSSDGDAVWVSGESWLHNSSEAVGDVGDESGYGATARHRARAGW